MPINLPTLTKISGPSVTLGPGGPVTRRPTSSNSFLGEQFSDPNSLEYGSPLLRAVALGRKDIVQGMLAAGYANLYERTRDASTALHICAQHNDEGMAILVLDIAAANGRSSALMRAKNMHQESALDVAVEAEHWEVVSVIIGHGCTLTSFFSTAYYSFLSSDQDPDLIDVRNRMIKTLEDRQKKSVSTPSFLHKAIYNRDLQVMNVLLEGGSDANTTEKGKPDAKIHFVILVARRVPCVLDSKLLFTYVEL